MEPKRILTMAIVLAAVLPPAGEAVTLNVPADHATIAAAVHAAAEGDTVLVAPGRYTEYVEITRNLVLRSSAGPDSTVLVSAGLGESPLDERLLDVRGEGIDRTTVIEGFSFDANNYAGTAIAVEDGSPTIRGNRIESPFGWGVKLIRSDARVEDNIIRGVRSFGMSIFASSPEVFRNEINDCAPRAIDVAGVKSHPIIGGSVENANRIWGNPLDLVNSSQNDVDATYNDWGWATTSEMEAGPYPQDITTIQDGHDLKRSNRGKGAVDYRNWITADATTTPESESSGPPWMLIGLIALGVILVGVVVARR